MITGETIARVKSSLQTTKNFTALEVIEKLEKENSELRGRITDLCKPPLYDGYSLQKEVAELKAQIDKMKNCLNCDKEYTNSPDCKDCRYSRKYDGKQDKWGR